MNPIEIHRALIAKPTLDDSGKFFQWDGGERAW